MKVEPKRTFRPIIITLETEEELKELTGALHKVGGSPILSTLWNRLQGELGFPMSGLFYDYTHRSEKPGSKS